MKLLQKAPRQARLSPATHDEGPTAHAARAAAPPPGTLIVHAFTRPDPNTVLPLPNAALLSNGVPFGATDGNGNAVFPGVPSNTPFTLTVRHDCHPDWRAPLRLAPGETREVWAELESVTLKDAAHARGITIGARLGEDLAGEFDGAVYPLFWNSRCPDTGPGIDNTPVARSGDLDKVQFSFNDKAIDATAAVAGFRLQATPLVWPSPQNSPGADGAKWPDRGWPGELLRRHARKNGRYDPRLVRRWVDRIHAHYIRACLQHNRDRGGPIREWIVVNEILNLKFHSKARAHGYWKRVGIWEKDKARIYAHVFQAFKAAFQADPTATLILNDYDVEGVDPRAKRPKGTHPDRLDGTGPKRSAYYYYWKPRLFRELAVWLKRELKKRLGPAAAARFAVGFQMHVPEARRRKGYLAWRLLNNLKFFKKKGIPVYVTEIDVVAPEAKQRDIYTKLFAALTIGGCKSITTWGLWDYDESGKTHRCLFSQSAGCNDGGLPYYRKPAYFGAVTGLRRAYELGPDVRGDQG